MNMMGFDLEETRRNVGLRVYSGIAGTPGPAWYSVPSFVK